MDSKRALVFLVLAAASLVCGLNLLVAQQRILALPAEFAAYRTWKPQIKTPYEVPYEMWIRCASPAQADLDAAAAQNGPSMRRTIQVYANDTAQRALKNSKPFPVGSILGKEKFQTSAQGKSEFAGIAFMIKRSGDRYPESGGWEFRYFPSEDGEASQIQDSCAGCHKTATRDFVFANYLAQKR